VVLTAPSIFPQFIFILIIDLSILLSTLFRLLFEFGSLLTRFEGETVLSDCVAEMTEPLEIRAGNRLLYGIHFCRFPLLAESLTSLPRKNRFIVPDYGQNPAPFERSAEKGNPGGPLGYGPCLGRAERVPQYSVDVANNFLKSPCQGHATCRGWFGYCRVSQSGSSHIRIEHGSVIISTPNWPSGITDHRDADQ
jgi:hypothetical protein